MIVQRDIPQQGLLHIQSGVETVGVKHIADTAIEPLDHAVRFRCSRLGQTMFDIEYATQQVKFMIAAGLACARGEQAVRELLAIVGQQFSDLNRTCLVQRMQKRPSGGGSLVVLDGDKYPARGAVNGHKQIPSARLVGHLGQVLDIHVQIARLVAFEGLVRHWWDSRFKRMQITSTMATQTAVQAETGS